MQNINKIIMASGGLDSTVLAYRAAKNGETFRLLHFQVSNDPYEQELSATRQLAFDLNVPLETVNLKQMPSVFLGHVEIGKIIMDEFDTDIGPACASGFPILLSAATFYAQVTNIREIEVGVIAEQAVTRPRLKQFYEQWTEMMAMFNPQAATVRVSTPLIDLSKAEVLKLGLEVGAPIHRTFSCLRPGQNHCGECNGCRERALAFCQTGCPDLTHYRVNPLTREFADLSA